VQPAPRRRARLARAARLRRTLDRFLHELLDTLTLLWPGAKGALTGRRFEAATYRVLFVLMLVGFANSNPTLRQMLDALL
jgi:hypothetical protein